MVPAVDDAVFTSLLTLATPASEDDHWLTAAGFNGTVGYGSRAFLSKLFEEYGYVDILDTANKVRILVALWVAIVYFCSASASSGVAVLVAFGSRCCQFWLPPVGTGINS